MADNISCLWFYLQTAPCHAYLTPPVCVPRDTKSTQCWLPQPAMYSPAPTWQALFYPMFIVNIIVLLETYFGQTGTGLVLGFGWMEQTNLYACNVPPATMPACAWPFMPVPHDIQALPKHLVPTSLHLTAAPSQCE